MILEPTVFEFDDRHRVADTAALQALLGEVGEASRKKEIDHVHPAYRALIAASPFAVVATSGPGGLDASPRGDPPGFVVVDDDRTLLMPERRGNHRGDTLHNLLVDPRIGLLFLIPGVGETLRVNGTAKISVDPTLLDRFLMQGKRPVCVLVVSVESVYFQCARAIHRSNLWKAPAPDARDRVPSPGAILEALTDAAIDGTTYDRELPERQRTTLY